MKKPQVWFTADTHFGHRRVIELCKRPFADVSEMRETMIARWNERVGPGDEVWHLGDFAYRASDDEIEQTFARLNGQKHLVIGNHDGTTTKLLPWVTRERTRYALIQMRTAAILMAARKLSGRRS